MLPVQRSTSPALLEMLSAHPSSFSQPWRGISGVTPLHPCPRPALCSQPGTAPGEPGGTPRSRRGDTPAAPGCFPPGSSVIFVNAY